VHVNRIRNNSLKNRIRILYYSLYPRRRERKREIERGYLKVKTITTATARAEQMCRLKQC